LSSSRAVVRGAEQSTPCLAHSSCRNWFASAVCSVAVSSRTPIASSSPSISDTRLNGGVKSISRSLYWILYEPRISITMPAAEDE
jgi:hypothetical protein